MNRPVLFRLFTTSTFKIHTFVLSLLEVASVWKKPVYWYCYTETRDTVGYSISNIWCTYDWVLIVRSVWIVHINNFWRKEGWNRMLLQKKLEIEVTIPVQVDYVAITQKIHYELGCRYLRGYIKTWHDRYGMDKILVCFYNARYLYIEM